MRTDSYIAHTKLQQLYSCQILQMRLSFLYTPLLIRFGNRRFLSELQQTTNIRHFQNVHLMISSSKPQKMHQAGRQAPSHSDSPLANRGLATTQNLQLNVCQSICKTMIEGRSNDDITFCSQNEVDTRCFKMCAMRGRSTKRASQNAAGTKKIGLVIDQEFHWNNNNNKVMCI